MTIGCNIWMICLKLNWFFYGLSRMLQCSEFVWTPCYSVWDVFNNFLSIDATDRSKITGDQKRFFIALSLYPLSFFANTPFKHCYSVVFLFYCFLVITAWLRLPLISYPYLYSSFVCHLSPRSESTERFPQVLIISSSTDHFLKYWSCLSLHSSWQTFISLANDCSVNLSDLSKMLVKKQIKHVDVYMESSDFKGTIKYKNG